MCVFGYVRVSAKDQNEDRQLLTMDLVRKTSGNVARNLT